MSIATQGTTTSPAPSASNTGMYQPRPARPVPPPSGSSDIASTTPTKQEQKPTTAATTTTTGQTPVGPVGTAQRSGGAGSEDPLLLDDASWERDEESAVKEIEALRDLERTKRSEVRVGRLELAARRRDVSETLHSYKQRLAKAGRGGRWSAFLTRVKISRATADRYVNTWEASLKQPLNCLTEAILSPDERINKMVAKLKPKLTKELTSDLLVRSFLERLGTALGVQTGASHPNHKIIAQNDTPQITVDDL